jgi:hypothetical protein
MPGGGGGVAPRGVPLSRSTHDLRLRAVSTDGQSVAAQVAALRKHGADKVSREVASGAKTDRARLRRLLDQLDAGDVLMVTRLDRLARSTRDQPARQGRSEAPSADDKAGRRYPEATTGQRHRQVIKRAGSVHDLGDSTLKRRSGAYAPPAFRYPSWCHPILGKANSYARYARYRSRPECAQGDD